MTRTITRDRLHMLILIFALGIVHGAAPRVLAADGEITSVTVFEDRARVERTRDWELLAGTTQVRFTGLTAALVEPSVTARIEGGRVLGVRLEWEFHEQDVREEVANLGEQIREKQREMRGLQHRQRVVEKLQGLAGEYAEVLETTLRERSAGDEVWTPEHTRTVLGAQNEISAWQLALGEELAGLTLEREQLGRELASLTENLQRLGRDSRKATRTAVVTVESLASGRGSLRLAYDVRGVAWRPRYEARLVEGEDRVEWSYQAEITQRSGEDWSGVGLVLSTARSSLGLAAPTLVPVRIGGYDKTRSSAGLVSKRIAADEKREGVLPDSIDDIDGEDAAGEDLSQAIVHQGGSPVRFEIRTSASIPTDGQPHRVTIGSATLEAELAFEAVPRLRPHVYRRARLVNDTELPFLPGVVQVFRDGTYVGNTGLPAVAPGAVFKLYFGAEGRLTVRRMEIRRRSEDPGMFSSKRTLTIAYRFDVASYMDRPVTLVLTDAVPVSELDDVTVEITPETQPRPSLHEENGRVRWNLTLAPGAKQRVVLEYEVVHPESFDLPLAWFQ